MFCGNLVLPELDKIQTIKELLCVKYGLISSPLFDVSQVDFMLESMCTRQLFLLTFLSVVFVRFYNKYILATFVHNIVVPRMQNVLYVQENFADFQTSFTGKLRRIFTIYSVGLVVIYGPTTPQALRHTTLWKIAVSFCLLMFHRVV